jgi:hypothetical protein
MPVEGKGKEMSDVFQLMFCIGVCSFEMLKPSALSILPSLCETPEPEGTDKTFKDNVEKSCKKFSEEDQEIIEKWKGYGEKGASILNCILEYIERREHGPSFLYLTCSCDGPFAATFDQCQKCCLGLPPGIVDGGEGNLMSNCFDGCEALNDD